MDQKDKLFDGILVFVEVVRCGGFFVVVEMLGCFVFYVFKEVIWLEECFGMWLLQWIMCLINLIEEGCVYFEMVEQIVDLVSQVEVVVVGIYDQLYGMLKIVVLMSYVFNFFNLILFKFIDQVLDVQLDIDLND